MELVTYEDPVGGWQNLQQLEYVNFSLSQTTSTRTVHYTGLYFMLFQLFEYYFHMEDHQFKKVHITFKMWNLFNLPKEILNITTNANHLRNKVWPNIWHLPTNIH